MIKALIGRGIGFSCGIKYVITAGLEVGSPPLTPTARYRTLLGAGL